MNVQLPVHMDKAAFLAWAEGREERYELVDGRAVVREPAIRSHALVVSNLIGLLHGQLNHAQWEVLAGFGVDAGPRTLRFPDAMVDRVGGAPDDRTAAEPVVLVEVMSPVTTKSDLGDKASEFLGFPGLAAYFVFAQDERKAWVWIRGSDGFPAGPEVFEGESANTPLPAVDITVPLADVYAGVALD
jgi:Uma2 family endonuclease